MVSKQQRFKNFVKMLNIPKALDKNILELVGGHKYMNACKFLMFIRAYNNTCKNKGSFLYDNKPYAYVTLAQIADAIECSNQSAQNIVKFCIEKGFIKSHNDNIRTYSEFLKKPVKSANCYLYTIDARVEEANDIHLEDIVVGPTEQVAVDAPETYVPAEGKFEGDKLETFPVREFYDRIRVPNTRMEVSDAVKTFKIKQSSWFFDIAANQCNTYFVGGLDIKTPQEKRCSDNDIYLKQYFAVDIDIRKIIMERTGEVISDNQLYGYIDEILKLLDESDFADYDEVVMSGNGVHIYYIGTPREFDKDIYKEGVRRIYTDIDDIIAPLGLITDKATSNISSLFRCPGSANYGRVEKYGLEVGQCFVYKRQIGGGKTFDMLEIIGAQVIAERHQEIMEKKLLVKEIVRTMPKKNGDAFEKINALPLDSIFSAYTGIELQSDGKNFKSNKDGKNIGCFYNKEKNIIVNTGTHYLSSDERSYNTFNFILKEVLGLSNTKENLIEVIEYCKQNYNI